MGNYKMGKIDIPLVICYLFLVFVGWINIFASVYSEEHSSIFDMSQRYGMQFIWIITAFILAASVIFVINIPSTSSVSTLPQIVRLLETAAYPTHTNKHIKESKIQIKPFIEAFIYLTLLLYYSSEFSTSS